MTLTELLNEAKVKPDGLHGDPEIASMTDDSRQVADGALFVCRPGTRTDSQSYIPEALARGAAAVLCFSPEGLGGPIFSGRGAAMVNPEGFNRALAYIAKAFYGNPSGKMKVVGVTGTNGKTTTAWLLQHVLSGCGFRAGYLGTLGISGPGGARNLNNTTPFAIELTQLVKELADSDTNALAMEVSSHALQEHRADGVEFDAAVFTNLTQDHLDFHGDMATYERAKWRLFTEFQEPKPFVGAVNVDDPVGARWFQSLPAGTIGFGVDGGDFRCTPIRVELERIEMDVSWKGSTVRVITGLGGDFNVRNSLAALAGAAALGIPIEQAAAALKTARPVPGRFETVPNDRGIGILVDYAHTPDALEKLLDSVRRLPHKRVITVFGCGGDRDRTKRPIMARTAGERSNLTVITSDNPRTEDPQAIVDEVETGLPSGSHAVKILDRREAVAFAIQEAEPGDVVVIAGKGHEDYQIIGRTKHPMDDRLLAKEALAQG